MLAVPRAHDMHNKYETGNLEKHLAFRRWYLWTTSPQPPRQRPSRAWSTRKCSTVNSSMASISALHKLLSDTVLRSDKVLLAYTSSTSPFRAPKWSAPMRSAMKRDGVILS